MRKPLIGVAIGVGSVVLAVLAGLLPFMRDVELKTYDRRLRWTASPADAPREIVLVEINEDSVRRLEPLVGRWPWPRLVHADLIDYLARAPARVIAYDILFTERDRRSGFQVGSDTWTGEESDRALAESTRRAGNVVHLAEATFEGLQHAPATTNPGEARGEWRPPADFALDATIEERPAIEPPFAELATASRAVGHNYLVLDDDGPVRQAVPFIRVGGQYVPSLAIATAMLAAAVDPKTVRVDPESLWFGRRRMPLIRVDVPAFGPDAAGPRRARRALIHYRGPAVLADGRSSTYRRYSFYDLFYSQQQLLAGQRPLIDPAAFKNTIVLVGTTAAGLHDVFAVPFGSTGKMAGTEIHANLVDNVLSERFMEPAAPALGFAIILASGVAAGLAATLLPVWVSVCIAGLVGAVLTAVAGALFARGLWLPMAQPVLAMGLAMFGGVAYQYFIEGREKRQVKQVFGRYVSREVFDQLMANPSLARLGGQRRDMTVLFSDIRGFTTVSERGEPGLIVDQLNEFFSQMVDVIFRHGGTIDKFVGDMVMALFGAPLDDPDHADHAVSAAVDMVRALGELNVRWTGEGRPTLDIGIGINSGDMVAGNIGSERIMSYTVIGDAVNLGARLESLNKEYGTRIIISEATRARLRGAYSLRPLGQVVVKGKTKAVDIYAVESRQS